MEYVTSGNCAGAQEAPRSVDTNSVVVWPPVHSAHSDPSPATESTPPAWGPHGPRVDVTVAPLLVMVTKIPCCVGPMDAITYALFLITTTLSKAVVLRFTFVQAPVPPVP